MPETPDRPAREARLLALVVIVAIVVLVLLARLRFPATGLSPSASTSGPLAGLAARATFDDMAAALTNLLARVTPSLITVELATATPTAPASPPVLATPAPAAAVPQAGVPHPWLVSALRVRRDLAVVFAAAGTRPVLAPGEPGTLAVVSMDADRELAIVRVDPSDSTPPITHEAFAGFGFVAVVDATASGPTIRPRFIGRVNTVLDPRWTVPLLSIGAPTDIVPGSWLFRLDGALLGLAVAGTNGVLIAPASALEAIAREASAGSAGS